MRTERVPSKAACVEARLAVRRRARNRILGLGLAFGLLFAAIAVRGSSLCLNPEPDTVGVSASTRWALYTVRAPRGDILDRNGRRLATTVSTPSVCVDPMLVPPEEIASLSAEVARILDVDAVQVADQMRRRTRYARIASHVHPADAEEIRKLGHDALWIERQPHRYYPEQSLAAQLIGFVNGDGNGSEGLEASLDEHLRGGVFQVQRRRTRSGLGVDGPFHTPLDAEGKDVHLTIDRVIQRAAERALEGVMERSAPQSAYAIVVDVKTGDILALANAPTFNPNALGDDPTPRRNHVVQDAIEPGSVFKPFTMAAALEEGLVDETTIVDCEGGGWNIGRSRIRDDHPHREITATEVIKFSSNIGSAKLAFRVGGERFLGYVRAFGFGSRTGIELPGERQGRVRSAERIKPIELATTAFGQGVTATPLQLAMATSAIANGGVLLKPRLVTEITDVDGLPVRQQRPEVVRRVVSEETAAALRRMMITVTERGGTATRAAVPGYLVAGKTGTAQKVKDGAYSDARIGSFLGFIPADDPVVAIVVTVDEPSIGSRYGGIVAAPAFAQIAEETMRHLGVPPNQPIPEEKASGIARLSPHLPQEPVRLVWDDEGWRVPDLEGRSVREVLVGLQGAGLRLRVEGSGHAVAQHPARGALLPVGGDIAVVFR